MGSVRTSIIGRPRRLPSDRHAHHHYTLDCEEPLNVEMWLQPEVDGATRALFREMQSHAFQVQLAAGDQEHEHDVEVDLSRITCPATVVSGGRDLSWFRAVADHLVAELPRATHIDLPWAGHLPNLERPSDTTQLIRRSLLG